MILGLSPTDIPATTKAHAYKLAVEKQCQISIWAEKNETCAEDGGNPWLFSVDTWAGATPAQRGRLHLAAVVSPVLDFSPRELTLAGVL